MKRLQTFTALLLVGTVAYASRTESTPLPVYAASSGTNTAQAPGPSIADLQAEIESLRSQLALAPASSFDDDPILDAAAAEPSYELLVFCTTNCPPCDVAKDKIIPWLEQHGWECTVCTSAASDLYGVDSFPTWVVTKDGNEVHRWVGAAWSQAGIDEINANLREALDLVAAPVAAVSASSSLKEWIADHYGPNDWGNWTHPDTIYNHLIEGHGWKASDLEGLSNREMNCLHDACHEGRISADGEHEEYASVSPSRSYSSTN